MKKLRFVIATALAGIMIISPLACATDDETGATTTAPGQQGDTGNTDDETEGEETGTAGELKENTMPITEDDITLVVYNGISAGARQIYSDLSESDIVQAMMEETGLKLDMVHPPVTDADTFFNTLIAGSEIPDVIQHSFSTYPGGAMAAMDDGLLLDDTELIDEYAYYFHDLLAQFDDEVRKNFLADDGRYYYFGGTFLPEFLDGVHHGGLVTRKDIMDELGFDELPITYDEFEELFDAYIDYGITPLAIAVDEWQFADYVTVAGGYGVRDGGFQLRDGEVKFSPTLPEYKDYLAKVAEWFEKGYFSDDALAMTSADAHASFTAGTGATTLVGSWEIKQQREVGRAQNPDFEIVALPVPRHNEDDVITTFLSIIQNPEGSPRFVSAASDHPVEAIRFIDYLYKDTTRKMVSWGINTDERTLWTENEDGTREWTDFMVNNPELDFESQRQRYTINPMTSMWDEEMERKQYEIPEVQQGWEAWSINTNRDDILSNFLRLSIEEDRERNVIMTEIDSYVQETKQLFFTGRKPIEEFDEFVETIRSMGIEDVEAIYQAAHERFLAR